MERYTRRPKKTADAIVKKEPLAIPAVPLHQPKQHRQQQRKHVDVLKQQVVNHAKAITAQMTQNTMQTLLHGEEAGFDSFFEKVFNPVEPEPEREPEPQPQPVALQPPVMAIGHGYFDMDMPMFDESIYNFNLQPVSEEHEQKKLEDIQYFNALADNSDDPCMFLQTFESFAQNLRPAEAEFVDDSDFIHCEVDPKFEEKKQQRKEANAFKNTNKVMQHRPTGSVMLMSRLPQEMKDCPCKCSTRNPSGEVECYENLAVLFRRQWVVHGERLQLYIPGYAQMGMKMAPAVVGTLKVVPNTFNNALPAFLFVDAGTQQEHCCPISWFYTTFLNLCAEGLIHDVPAVALQVREQMKLRSNCFRFVVAQATNVTLHKMVLLYRHTIGMHQAAEASRIRISNKGACEEGVPFMTRDEMRAYYAPKAAPLFPELSLWLQSANRYIDELQQIIEGQRVTIATLTSN